MGAMNFDLDDVALFLRVAELGSLSAAARERHAPVSQVSRCLARLETQSAVRLMHRTTHGLSLTDEGDTFAAHARRLLDTRDELAAAFRHKRAGPSGWVRLSVSPGLAQSVIVPSLPSLYEAHPQLQVELVTATELAALNAPRATVLRGTCAQRLPNSPAIHCSSMAERWDGKARQSFFRASRRLAKARWWPHWSKQAPSTFPTNMRCWTRLAASIPSRSRFRFGKHGDHARSKRSRFITLVQAATKSLTNFSCESDSA